MTDTSEYFVNIGGKLYDKRAIIAQVAPIQNRLHVNDAGNDDLYQVCLGMTVIALYHDSTGEFSLPISVLQKMHYDPRSDCVVLGKGAEL